MSDTQLTDCEECLPPSEAFGVVANETRLAILEALWNADDRPVAFSELRRAVGLRDSAQFNYHLDKLRGHFVRKTDGGYEFEWAGLAVVHAVLSGSFNESPSLDPFAVRGTCVDCEGRLQARYEDGVFVIECGACDRIHSRNPFPPGGLEGRSREELLNAYDQRSRHLICLAADGVCWACNGRRTIDLVADDPGIGLGLSVRADLRCTRCDHTISIPVGLTLLDNADVVTFYRDHGVDLSQRPHWTLDWCVSDRHTEVVSTDPWRVRVTIPLEDELLRVTLDGRLQPVETERVERSRQPA